MNVRKTSNLGKTFSIMALALFLSACATKPVKVNEKVNTLHYEGIYKPSVMALDEYVKLDSTHKEQYLTSVLVESFRRIDLLNNYIENNNKFVEEQNEIIKQ